MIEINCYGGQIGRFWWKNSGQSGGRCGWDHAWPDRHAWPVMPWGPGDPVDEHWRDFAAFEPWFDDQLDNRNLDEIDFTITEKIELYSLLCDVFHAGVEAGQNPWQWAWQLAQRSTTAKVTPNA